MKASFEADADRVRLLHVDGRGRVTIPKDIRRELDLRKGDTVEVVIEPESE